MARTPPVQPEIRERGTRARGDTPAPVPDRKRFWTPRKLGAAFLAVAAIAGTLAYYEWEKKPQWEKEKLDKDRIDRVYAERPGDKEALTDQRKFSLAAAQFVDCHLSWQRTSAKGATPITSTPKPAIQQMRILALELGQEKAFEKFLDKTEYRWNSSEYGILLKAEKIEAVMERNRDPYVLTHLSAAETLLDTLKEDSRFRILIGQPRFEALKNMMDGLGQAKLHVELGSGFKKPTVAAPSRPAC